MADATLENWVLAGLHFCFFTRFAAFFYTTLPTPDSSQGIPSEELVRAHCKPNSLRHPL